MPPADQGAGGRVSGGMKLVLVAAVARNGAIGKDNALLWRLPEDLKHFKSVTLGHPIVMGRRTFDSIGRPLPGRRNLVVTRNPAWRHEGVESFASLDAALAAAEQAHPADDTICIIGGGELYAQALPRADELLLTEIDADFEADTFFPAWARGAFDEVERETHASEAGWAYHFVTYRRRKA